MKKHPKVRALKLDRTTVRRLTVSMMQTVQGAKQRVPESNEVCTKTCPTVCKVTSCIMADGFAADLIPQCP